MMQRWEYATQALDPAENCANHMNKAGADGWELVAVLCHAPPAMVGGKVSYNAVYHAIFKRPLT